MLNCEKCSSVLPDNARFCGKCGHVQTTGANSAPLEVPGIEHIATATLQENPDVAETQIIHAGSGGGETARENLNDISRTPTTSLSDAENAGQEVAGETLVVAYADAATVLTSGQKKDEQMALADGFFLGSLAAGEMLATQLPGAAPLAGNMPALPGTPPLNSMPALPGTPPPSIQAPNAPYAPHPPTLPPMNHGAPGIPGANSGAPSGPALGNTPGSQVPPVNQGGQAPPSMHAPEPLSHTAAHTAAHVAKAGKVLAKPAAGGLHSLLSLWIVIPAVVVLAAAGALGTNFIFIPASLGLAGNTSVMSGLTMHIQGNHFVPGGQITLKLDNHQPVTPASAITINAAGNFDAQINGTENWALGMHTLDATESTLARGASIRFTVVGNSSKVTPSITTFTQASGQCTYAAQKGWTCATTLSIGSGQGIVHWTTASTGVSGITFTPSSGNLEPGRSQAVSIFIPDTVCPAQATLTFGGWDTPITIAWNCNAPTLEWTGGTCPSDGTTTVCTIPLSLSPGTQGEAKWTATSPQSYVSISPSSGTLAVGQVQKVVISIPTANCPNTQISFNVVGGTSSTGYCYVQ